MSNRPKSRAVATYFFATRNDFVSGCESADRERKLKYIERGSFETSNIVVWEKVLDIPDFGVAVVGDSIHEKSYLVMDIEDEFRVREVPQRRGGVRYIVDGSANPNSIMFQPGGVFTNLCIVRGELSADSSNPTSMELYDFFLKKVTQGFKRVKKIYYVGPEALQLSKGRIRLTHSLHTSSEYDLKIDD